MLIFLFNANLSMMNIRDIIFINKAKSVNKIRILDILGFDTNINISHSSEIIKDTDVNQITSESEAVNLLKEESKSEVYSYIDNNNEAISTIDETSTQTFEPLKVTSQFKKLWTDIESRRKWIVPATLIMSTIFLIFSVTSIFVNNRNNEIAVTNLYLTLTTNSNDLIIQLEDIIEISTDNFYSKYDVSNSSANLQLIESTIMEYERNLENRSNLVISSDITNNLNNIFILVNDLDKLISYRILLSEILIYDDLLLINDNLDINILSNKLSEISATSKLNYEQLPDIDEFNIHYSLLNETLNSAEDLHGRLIAALRNNEIDVAKALIIAINMNKQIEQDSFNEALYIFKENKINLYKNIVLLP